MKQLISIFLFVILSLSKDRQCVAQNFSLEEQHQIDSLNDIIANPNSHDTSLACAYVGLSDILYISNIDTVLPLCEKSKAIAEKSVKKNVSEKVKRSLLKSLANSLNNIGYVYHCKAQNQEAIDYYSRSLKIREEIEDKEGIATSLNNLGVTYKNQGQTKKAINYYHRSLKVQEEIGDKYGIAASLNNIGLIYQNQNQIKEALNYYHQSLKIQEEIADKHGIAVSLNKIGIVYKNQNQIKEALYYYHQSLKIREEIGDKKGIANSLNNIGVLYKSQGQIGQAINYYHRSLKIQEEIGDKLGVALSLNNIGLIYIKQGHLKEALDCGKKSLSIAKERDNPEQIRNASDLLSSCYQKQGSYKEALAMYKLHIQMRDSLNNEETQKAAAKQQAQYEYEKQKAIDDKEHEKQLAIEQEAKEKQQVITYATAGGLGLVGIFLIFVFNRLQVTKRQKNIIEEQKQEVETQKAEVEHAHNELAEKNQEILDSINYAKRIQNAILPPQKVVKEYLQESFILYKPKDIVAGDFYWLEHKEDKVMFAACDCTGHGVPGAMVSVVCNNGLNRSVREYNLTDPGKILDKTREIVIQEFEKSEEEVKDGMDIALCTLQGNTLHYAGANNPLWIIRNNSEEIEEIKADKQPIGKYAEPTPYTTHKIELQKGDTIYIFSDGYADQFGGEKGKKFKAANFKKLLLSIQNESIEQQRELINQAFEDWKGDLEQLDDVCVIGVRKKKN
ncbi:MAG: tetratricopeptide repeat protein [Flavobacteriales bacterium]|nr:tetratricopeptide repeat protein [Flavobacteriales bacterium]